MEEQSVGNGVRLVVHLPGPDGLQASQIDFAVRRSRAWPFSATVYATVGAGMTIPVMT